MTDEHLDDDALSASLDGEATADEVAHLDGCEACRARLGELRSAANLIGSPVAPVDDARREEAIAAALVAMPTPIRRSRRTVPPWLLAAAAILVVAIALVPLLDRSSGGDADRDASSAASSAGTAELKSAAPSAEDATPFLASPGPGPDLGAFGTDEPLRDRVLAALPESASATSTTGAVASGATAAPACPEVGAGDPALGALVLEAVATIGDTPVRILVYRVGTDELRAIAAAVDDCRVLRSETFPAP
jgi:hypothetical protein